MKLFIGSGPQFLNECIQLTPSSKESEWEDFKNLNKNLEIFKFDHLFQDYPTFFILYEEKEIVAVLKTQKSSFYQDKFPFQGINYISIKNKYQGQGLARQLVQEMFNLFKFVVGTDYVSSDSEVKLKNMGHRLAKLNQVYFLTRKEMYKYGSDLPETLDELYSKEEYL